jgi:uncharacterized OB-fold protein
MHTNYYASVLSEVTRPDPIVTEDSAAFWDAASESRLVAQRCAECQRLRHPPRPMCPYCGSLAVELTELSGHGVVYSYAVVHHPQHRAFEYPVVVVLVDLDEGVRLLSNLTDVPTADLRIGMPVEVHFVPTVGGMAVPQFHAATTPA